MGFEGPDGETIESGHENRHGHPGVCQPICNQRWCPVVNPLSKRTAASGVRSSEASPSEYARLLHGKRHSSHNE
jgi:hypothetical protein